MNCCIAIYLQNKDWIIWQYRSDIDLENIMKQTYQSAHNPSYHKMKIYNWKVVVVDLDTELFQSLEEGIDKNCASKILKLVDEGKGESILEIQSSQIEDNKIDGSDEISENISISDVDEIKKFLGSRYANL